MTLTAATVLQDAADLIEEKGWIQGKYRSEDGFCALGAIRTVVVKTGTPLHFRDDLREQVLDALSGQTGGVDIVAWNDEPGRTKDEVVAALRKAALREEVRP